MRNTLTVLGLAGMLSGCGQAAQEQADNKAVAAEKPKPAHCFFKDADMKGWAATRGKDGNITVKGKAYRSDPRYKAYFSPATVAGNVATIAPTIGQNDTGYGAPDNWWDVSATIPNSAAVDTVKVECGAKTVAELKVAPKG